MKRTGRVCATLLVVASLRGPEARSASQVPVIVELFTSEGCSSCPPADQLLEEIVRLQPVKDALIVGLGEHVDYWDHLGWRDPFSAKQFSTRQSTYAAARSSEEVYTPQMIVDGTRVFVGQNRAAALDAVARAAGAPKAPVDLTWMAGAGRSLQIRVHPAAPSAGAQVFLAITEDHLSSSVAGGENQGRRLSHAAVVRQLADIGRADASGAFQKTVPITVGPAWRVQALHAVVFAQRRPLGAITRIGVINF